MRIASLHCAPYALPFHRPLVTARETLTQRRGWLLRLSVSRGSSQATMTGIGESAPLPQFGGESHDAAWRALESWTLHLPGNSLYLPPHRTGETQPALGLLDDAPSKGLSTPAAHHGLETALLDLAASAHNLSFSQWLHPDSNGSVRANATLGGENPENTLAQARQALTQGFDTFKVKVGALHPEVDEHRLRSLRETLGPTVRLRIDANGAWDESTALNLLHRWEGFGLDYVEQPVSADDDGALASMVRLSQESPVPIAADESLRSAHDAQRILEAGAASILVLKPMLLGGAITTLRIAALAHARGVPVVVTTSLEGVVGRRAALHTAAAVDAMHKNAGLPLPPPAHGLATGGLLAVDHLTPILPEESGCMLVPDSQGLGLPPFIQSRIATE